MNIRSYGERPESKEAVRERLESIAFVNDVGDMGTALTCTLHDDTVSTFGGFIRSSGWVPVSAHEHNGRRHITFAPIDGVVEE